MGAVKIINKSRKETRCMKCGNTIPVGSKYYRGELNFSRDIIRCETCKLQHWEVTTSDYQLRVGALVYKWRESYDLSTSGVEEIISELEDIRDDLQDRLDNMPEGLQQGDTGQLLQDRIDNLESAIDELSSIDEDCIKEEIASEYGSEDDDEEPEYDEDNAEMVEAFEEKISDAIDEALGCIEF